MPSRLEKWLRERIEKSVGIPALFGWGSLVAISLALPDFQNWGHFLSQFDSLRDAVTFFRPKIPAMLLIATTIYWFYRYKGAVIKELTQINEVFQEERAPQYYGNIEGYKLIPLIG